MGSASPIDGGSVRQDRPVAVYVVYGVNPLQVACYRVRHDVSGAKSVAAHAHTLADMVRTDSHQLRPVAAHDAAPPYDHGQRPWQREAFPGPCHPARQKDRRNLFT